MYAVQYFSLLFFIILALRPSTSQVPKSPAVKCAVCKSLISELHYEMSKVNPRIKIDIGSRRLATDGNQATTQRSYVGSETHMTELLDSICLTFKDYAQAHHKETGEMEVINLIGKDGKLNPRFSEYEIVKDPDLNTGVVFHCESIVEDFEDDIVDHISALDEKTNLKKSQYRFCTERTRICPKTKTEL